MEEENKTYIQKKIEMELNSLEPPKPMSLKQSIWFVIAAHILIGGLIYGYSNKSHAKEDKKFLETKDAEYAGIPEPTPSPSPTPSPTPTPQATPVVVTNVEIPKTNDWPKPKSIPSVYYVNSGDTLYSISKRYNVPIKTIKKLNNLKDNSKIKLGQKIKLK